MNSPEEQKKDNWLADKVADFISKKAKISKAKKLIEENEAKLSELRDDIVRDFQQFRITGLVVGENTVSLKDTKMYFYPAKTDIQKRVDFMNWVKEKYGHEYLMEKVSMPFQTVTTIHKAAEEEGWIKKEELIKGCTRKVSLGLKIKKNK